MASSADACAGICAVSAHRPDRSAGDGRVHGTISDDGQPVRLVHHSGVRVAGRTSGCQPEFHMAGIGGVRWQVLCEFSAVPIVCDAAVRGDFRAGYAGSLHQSGGDAAWHCLCAADLSADDGQLALCGAVCAVPVSGERVSVHCPAGLGVVPGADDVLHAFADGGRCGAARQKRLGAGVVGVRSWVPTDGGAVSSAAGVSAQQKRRAA